VPRDDGLGPDQHEVAPPVAAETAGDDPHQLVAGVDGGALAGRAGQDGELAAHEQVFDDEIATATQGGSDGGQNESEHFDHGAEDR
jgi:hypothetical protein